MIYAEAFLSAVKAVWAHKMRSFLTMLGIIIGIFSVTALISVGQGSTMAITDSIEGMGSNLMSVSLKTQRVTFVEKHLDEMEQLQGVGLISPYAASTYTVKSSMSSLDNIQCIGVYDAYQEIKEYELSSGRFISSDDGDRRARVVVIGSEIASELYGVTSSAVGQKITLDGTKFTVVGVLDSKGTTATVNEDEIVLTPFSTMQRIMKDTKIKTVYVSASSSDMVEIAQESLENYLFGLTQDENAYRIFSQSAILESLEESTSALTAMLGGIAAISLLVGGIGIMNIMLVSVTERTREIGIEKAIGATRKDILTQFLIEAIIVSGIGGIIGVALAYGSKGLLSNLIGSPVVIQSSIVLIAISFSLGVGIIFGMYPAMRASKLSPIEALRYE
jgi:putative ABC transport system permease protein